MRISVIIPTYNGAHKISGILESLIHQTWQPEEVIVVVDGSTDETVDVLDDFMKLMPNLRYVYQTNRGRAAVRNTGASLANGDLMIFFDDDIRLRHNTIEQHLRFFRQKPGALYAGPALLDPERVQGNRFLEYRMALESKWIESYPLSPVKVTFTQYAFTTQNLSMPAKVFFLVGPFDERLSDGEDLELSLRAMSKSIPVYFDKANYVWHEDFIDIISYINRQTQYIKSKYYIEAIRPDFSSLAPNLFAYGKSPGLLHRAVYVLLNYYVLGKFLLRLLCSVRSASRRFSKVYDVVIYASVLAKLKKRKF